MKHFVTSFRGDTSARNDDLDLMRPKVFSRFAHVLFDPKLILSNL